MNRFLAHPATEVTWLNIPCLRLELPSGHVLVSVKNNLLNFGNFLPVSTTIRKRITRISKWKYIINPLHSWSYDFKSNLQNQIYTPVGKLELSHLRLYCWKTLLSSFVVSTHKNWFVVMDFVLDLLIPLKWLKFFHNIRIPNELKYFHGLFWRFHTLAKITQTRKFLDLK